MLMRGAAILDFEVRVGEVLPTVRLVNPTSGGVPVEISDWKLRNSDFRVQMEHTISHYAKLSQPNAICKQANKPISQNVKQFLYF